MTEEKIRQIAFYGKGGIGKSTTSQPIAFTKTLDKIA
jgi:nitrogenase subunit NifH